MYTEKYKEMTLSASSYDRKISIEIPLDSDANEVFRTFKALMVGLTFADKAFDDAVVTYFYENELDKES